MFNVSEGYVKYKANHTAKACIKETVELNKINEARTKFYSLGLIGIYPNGISFGNVSIRFLNNEFIISGTATGNKPVLSLNEYCIVKNIDIYKNQIISCGPVQASSEAMTHGAIYLSNPEINCVIHIHSKKIFDEMLNNNYPATDKNAAYGTPEIAEEIIKRVKETGVNGQIIMTGHEEGIIVYGQDIDNTFEQVITLHNKYGGYNV